MQPRRLMIAASAALAVACGGGSELLALVPIVGPIGGLWTLDAAPDSPTLQAVPGEFLNSMGPSATAFATYPLNADYDVSGTLGTQSGPCAVTPDVIAIDVRGRVSGDQLVLVRDDDPSVECLRARFIDARTLEVDGTTRYRNTTPQYALERHEWVNADNAAQRFKFTVAGDATDNEVVNLEGCRVEAGTVTTFSGVLQGFVTATGVGPRIVDFTVGTTNHGVGELRSPREIVFDGGGLTLRRVAEGAVPITCD